MVQGKVGVELGVFISHCTWKGRLLGIFDQIGMTPFENHWALFLTDHPPFSQPTPSDSTRNFAQQAMEEARGERPRNGLRAPASTDVPFLLHLIRQTLPGGRGIRLL